MGRLCRLEYTPDVYYVVYGFDVISPFEYYLVLLVVDR